jgi:hypothetical protein
MVDATTNLTYTTTNEGFFIVMFQCSSRVSGSQAVDVFNIVPTSFWDFDLISRILRVFVCL